MAIDRAEAIKKAEKLLRQGKLDLAIAEYVRMIEEQPRDWNTRNTLGDLYVRASQLEQAAAQYGQIADHLFTEGFFPKAAAIYKKILKIKPEDEPVQLQLAEISAKQGLLADAKAYFVAVAAKRKQRGDTAGADEIIIRLGSLDPSDFEARGLAAQTLAQNGDAVAAAAIYRAMHADLAEKGRGDEAHAALREAVRLNHDDQEGRAILGREAIAKGDLETAKQYLDRAIAGEDPALLLPLMEIELRSGNLDAAKEILAQLLHIDANLRTQIVELAWTIAPVTPEGAYLCIETVVDAQLAGGHYMDAAAVLQEFVTRVSGQIGPLLKLVEICVDGGLEAIMYETQAHLADAYLETGQGAEARVIAEDLVAREPWEPAHIDRFRRALILLEVPDPDAVIADRLSGQGPFVATDPFMAPEPLEDLGELPGDPAEPETADPVADLPDVSEPELPHRPAAADPDIPLRPRAAEPDIPLRPRSAEPDIPLRPRPAEPDIPLRPRAAEPDIPLRPRTAEPDIPLRPRSAEPDIPLRPRQPDPPPAPMPSSGSSTSSGNSPEPEAVGMDIDLTDVLSELQGVAAVPVSQPVAAQPPQDLDAVFNEFRSEVSKQSGASEAAEYLSLARTYLEMGMTEEAIGALTTAAAAPSQRFEAASLLGRLHLKNNDLAHAVEWLERAAEAPAPGVNEARELLYDLGAILETSGETSRALAVFLELQADAGDYRDVPARVERLSRAQAGG